MFGALFFIPAAVFFILAIVFSLAIAHVEKIPRIISLNIGKLHADDIRRLDPIDRNDLRNQVAFHFVAAAAAALIIGILFIVFGSASNPLLALACNLVAVVVGGFIALGILKKAGALKEKLR